MMLHERCLYCHEKKNGRKPHYIKRNSALGYFVIWRENGSQNQRKKTEHTKLTDYINQILVESVMKKAQQNDVHQLQEKVNIYHFKISSEAKKNHYRHCHEWRSMAKLGVTEKWRFTKSSWRMVKQQRTGIAKEILTKMSENI